MAIQNAVQDNNQEFSLLAASGTSGTAEARRLLTNANNELLVSAASGSVVMTTGTINAGTIDLLKAGTITSILGGTIATKTPLTASSPTVGTVGTTSAALVATNANRKGLILVNLSASTVSLGIDAAAVLSSGITLTPGGVFQMDEYCFAVGTVLAIASAGTSLVSVQEFS